jgi:hypothetical protein
MIYSPNYRTFSSDNVAGKVTKVDGNVFYSPDHEYIRIKLKHFYTSTIVVDSGTDGSGIGVLQRPDGGYEPIVPPGARKGPDRYVPRVLEGP